MSDDTTQSRTTQLPLRKRGTMEIFDVSVKLYKRYFVPIIIWAIVSGISGLAGAVIPGAGLLSFVITPFLFGSVGCCVAAAVHGYDVTVKDCWEFSKRRYGGIFLTYFVSTILGIFLYLLIAIPAALLIFGGGAILANLLSTNTLTILGIVVGILVMVVASFVLSCGFAWANTVPLALCLEGNGADNMRFLRRTYELMRGHWWRIFSLISLIGLAALALFLIVAGAASAVQGVGNLRDILNGQVDEGSLLRLVLGYGMAVSVVSILLTPFFYLSLSVQYLDLRVRKEALDLEWATRESAEGQLAG